MNQKSLLLVLALPLLIAATAYAMTADELIAKSFEARGGLDKIKAVQSIETTGRFNGMGMEFSYTRIHARPYRMRIEADLGGAEMIQVWNGDSGWMINPLLGSQDPKDMGPDESRNVKLQADMDGVLVDYADKGYTIEYIGEDEIEGTPIHHLRVDSHDDLVVDMYFDAETFLLTMFHSNMSIYGQEIETDTYLSDFRAVGGLIVPHSIETFRGGQAIGTETIDTMKFDVPVDDGLFEKPDG